MKTKHLSAKDARATFSDVLGSVYYRNEPVIIEKNGRPVAVVISPQMFEVVERTWQREWEAQQEVWAKNAHLDPDEVYADITDAVEHVRTERRKAAQAEGAA